MFASEAELVRFKVEVTRELAPSATGVLLDPEYGAAQAVAAGALPGDRGLVVALEATGYSAEAMSGRPQLLEGWSVEKAKRMGAQMAKLLVRYHPEAPGAGEVEALVAQVAAECVRFDLALMIEPLVASGALFPAEKNRAAVEAARRLSAIPGVDLLKMEFPASPEATDEEAAAVCAELSAASRVPWVLLSAAVDFETYQRQVEIACRAGASGVAVGRAVWQEAAQLSGPARLEFLRTAARERLERLRAVVRALARPFTDFYTAEAPLGWYRAYSTYPNPNEEA